MTDRYPYLRLVIGIAQGLAGAIAAVVVLGGLVSSCRIGGFGGFVELIVTVLVAGVAYVSTMIWVESMRVFLDIESHTRQLVDLMRDQRGGPAPPPAA
ncbi:MAG TPA: hypothetical protein VL403_11275 [Candidatus Kryptonia bacterium]|nr:hypothetical protein [Candidatus Kryptonia bacterium]